MGTGVGQSYWVVSFVTCEKRTKSGKSGQESFGGRRHSLGINVGTGGTCPGACLRPAAVLVLLPNDLPAPPDPAPDASELSLELNLAAPATSSGCFFPSGPSRLEPNTGLCFIFAFINFRVCNFVRQYLKLQQFWWGLSSVKHGRFMASSSSVCGPLRFFR